jgi:hypothetical protein
MPGISIGISGLYTLINETGILENGANFFLKN